MAEKPEPWHVLIIAIFGLNFWKVDKLRERALPCCRVANGWGSQGQPLETFVVRGLSVTGRWKWWWTLWARAADDRPLIGQIREVPYPYVLIRCTKDTASVSSVMRCPEMYDV